MSWKKYFLKRLQGKKKSFEGDTMVWEFLVSQIEGRHYIPFLKDFFYMIEIHLEIFLKHNLEKISFAKYWDQLIDPYRFYKYIVFGKAFCQKNLGNLFWRSQIILGNERLPR
jgi:hypothetical protein